MQTQVNTLLICSLFCYAQAHATTSRSKQKGQKSAAKQQSVPAVKQPSITKQPPLTKAVLFEFKNKTEKPDFTFDRKDSKNSDGSSTQESFFRYPDGRIALTEKLVFDPEGKISTYFYDQKQISQRIWLNVEGRSLKMKKEWYEGEKVTKTEEETETYKPNMHIGPELQDLTLRKWDTLTAGESYKFKLIIMERLDTFSFELEYDGLQDLGGKKAHQFSLYPRSLIIRMLVTKIRFYFENTPERKFIEVQGTLPVKPWNGKEWDGIFDGVMKPTY